jgi:tetratricopeptide (TPR) repeat protein
VPLGGVWVTIRSLRTGAVVFSVNTAQDGSFDAPVTGNGSYEVVAQRGNDQDRAVADPESSMSLRLTLPTATAQRAEAGASVSVADLKAPRKAQQELEKATKALREKDTAGARKHVENAVQIYPDYPSALTFLALMQASDDRAAALLTARRAAELSPGRAFTRAVLAGILNDSGQPVSALEEANAAIAISSSQWQGHFERARALAKMGRLDEALTSAARADELVQGKVLSVSVARSRLLAALGRPDEARDRLNAFIQRAPDKDSKERATAEKLTINTFAKK